LNVGARITKNLARKITEAAVIDAVRKEGRQYCGRSVPVPTEEAPEPDGLSEAENLGSDNPASNWYTLWEAVKALPYRQREAVLLGYWAGHDTHETAALMGVGVRSVQGLLARAIESAKEFLGDVRFQGTGNDYISVEWFRVYVTLKDDPKVQLLPAELFRFLVNSWCVARQHDGLLPDAGTLAFQLRVTETQATEYLHALVECGLVDRTDLGLMPHNWNTRQYVSDASTSRVRRHREKAATLLKRSVKEAMPVTVEEWTEWRCFMLWVSGGLNAMDGSMASEVKDALDSRCPGFLESETQYFTECHDAREPYDWPLDFIAGLVEWGYARVFAGRAVPSDNSQFPKYRSAMQYVLGQEAPRNLQQWRERIENYPTLKEWGEAVAVA
jgi:hypothetical protein